MNKATCEKTVGSIKGDTYTQSKWLCRCCNGPNWCSSSSRKDYTESLLFLQSGERLLDLNKPIRANANQDAAGKMYWLWQKEKSMITCLRPFIDSESQQSSSTGVFLPLQMGSDDHWPFLWHVTVFHRVTSAKFLTHSYLKTMSVSTTSTLLETRGKSPQGCTAKEKNKKEGIHYQNILVCCVVWHTQRIIFQHMPEFPVTNQMVKPRVGWRKSCWLFTGRRKWVWPLFRDLNEETSSNDTHAHTQYQKWHFPHFPPGMFSVGPLCPPSGVV